MYIYSDILNSLSYY